jgi:hypothetical protein
MPVDVGPVTRAVEQLEDAIDALLAEDVTGRPLGDELVRLERVRSRLDAGIAQRLADFERQVGWSADGARSAAGWLIAKTRCASGGAHHRMHVARQMAAMPIASAAWRSGAITTDHAAVMARIRSGARANAEFAIFEPALVDAAKKTTPEDVMMVGPRWRDALDDYLGRPPKKKAAGRDHDRRKLHWSRILDGVGILNGRFDCEGAEYFETALHKMCDRLRQRDDPRTPAQLRADALVELAREFLDHQDRGSNRPHALFIIDEPTCHGETVGRCQTSSGYQMSPETVRRIMCDSIIQHLWIDDHGVPLDMSRAVRTFTADQYRAMVVRDGGCRFPGCDASPQHCEAHHRDAWVHDHGPTDMANGLLACRGRGHHRYLHEGEGRVEGNANGRLDWYARDGTYLGSTEPQVPPKRILTRHGQEMRALRTRIKDLIHDANAPPPKQAA